MKPFALRKGLLPVLSVALASCATSQAPAQSPTAGSSEATFGNCVPAHRDTEASLPTDQDPAQTDGDKYRVVLDNSNVRVFHYTDKPGDRTHEHHHPEFVLYALSSFRRKLSFPDGTSKERDFVRGDVIWMPAQTHIGENTGSTDTDVVIVEMKQR
jgi:quercetin dioxygenase-like cupin family protein